jgi:hypothetical protein
MTGPTFADPLVERIASFLNEIGLEVRHGTVGAGTALPGILIDGGVLVVDEATMLYPGDLLHEAGHLAVVPPARRTAFLHDAGDDPAEEMMAIAWSYAAALHLKIDPTIIFHKGGYRGGGSWIVENFAAGCYFGVPMLDYVGLAVDIARARREGLMPYPHMRRWLRED